MRIHGIAISCCEKHMILGRLKALTHELPESHYLNVHGERYSAHDVHDDRICCHDAKI